MKTFPRALLLALALLLTQACSDRDSPEDQVRRFIDVGVDAAENRSVDGLVDLLHADYIDERGNNRIQLGNLLRAYFFRHRNIHLFTSIDSIEMSGENQAAVIMHVAMAGTVISDVDALARLSARVYRFELQLLRQDEWALRHASWAPANIGALE